MLGHNFFLMEVWKLVSRLEEVWRARVLLVACSPATESPWNLQKKCFFKLAFSQFLFLQFKEMGPASCGGDRDLSFSFSWITISDQSETTIWDNPTSWWVEGWAGVELSSVYYGAVGLEFHPSRFLLPSWDNFKTILVRQLWDNLGWWDNFETILVRQLLTIL